MSPSDAMPELKQLLGALIFCSTNPLTIREMRKCLGEVAERCGGPEAVFAKARDKEIRNALEEFGRDLEKARPGFSLMEVAGGYRLQSDAACGKWVRNLLNADRPRRMSVPGLETLAIIAYRQPVSKPEIEAVRGVNADHMIKTLMEMQLVRIVGRSDLPGRPFLYGTTHHFLEHFGLKNLNDLSRMEPSLAIRYDNRSEKKAETASEEGDEEVNEPEGAGQQVGDDDDDS